MSLRVCYSRESKRPNVLDLMRKTPSSFSSFLYCFPKGKKFDQLFYYLSHHQLHYFDTFYTKNNSTEGFQIIMFELLFSNKLRRSSSENICRQPESISAFSRKFQSICPHSGSRLQGYNQSKDINAKNWSNTGKVESKAKIKQEVEQKVIQIAKEAEILIAYKDHPKYFLKKLKRFVANFSLHPPSITPVFEIENYKRRCIFRYLGNTEVTSPNKIPNIILKTSSTDTQNEKKSLSENYYPISLLSHISKVIEKCIIE